MKYDYFGNTSLRVQNLLLNFETQIILFESLFRNAPKKSIWSNNSELQIQYLELLEQHNLLDSKNKTANLGTKDARVKSAPLEDYGLIRRKEKIITEQGYELLKLINSQSYKIDNEFLQIDLISLFFLKATLNFKKSPNLLQKYLIVFFSFGGELDIDKFILLPLVNNFENTQSFVKHINENNVIENILNNNDEFKNNVKEFIRDLQRDKIKNDYFKTAKGDKTANSIIDVLKNVFIPYLNTKNSEIFDSFLNDKNEKYYSFKKLYLKHILDNSRSKIQKIETLKEFCKVDNLECFGYKFYTFIFKSRVKDNLNDYLDLNRRYLNLTGIFEFQKDKVELNAIFKLILKNDKLQEILNKIASSQISSNTLNEYFTNFKNELKCLNIYSLSELKNYKREQNKKKIKNLLETDLTKDKIIKILNYFNDRNNDDKIFNEVTSEASIPTIFEYVVAISWCYIDNFNVNRILDAGLSLDSNLLPKSHAVGGNADFVYKYTNHFLMIEVTLTEKTNQRRAEMESVSRHLGSLLLKLQPEIQSNSYGIFIAPYLDKNVMNDFRSRIHCYFENENKFIRGMKIMPLSVNNLISILESNYSYEKLHLKFKKLLDSENDFGSKWYESEILPFIKSLGKQDAF